MLFETNRAVVVKRLRRWEQQQAETVALPAIVLQEALEADFLSADLIVNRSDAAGIDLRSFVQTAVIGFDAALERIDQSDTGGAAIERANGASVGGAHQRREPGRSHVKLIVSIGIKVKAFASHRCAARRRNVSRQRL